jgi:hypothetical protein
MSEAEESQADPEGNKFIVPDGYISQDEKHDSDIELEKEGEYVVSNFNNKNNLFDIMGVKEDVTKPFILTLSNSNNQLHTNPKINKISSMVTAILLKNKENSK